MTREMECDLREMECDLREMECLLRETELGLREMSLTGEHRLFTSSLSAVPVGLEQRKIGAGIPQAV